MILHNPGTRVGRLCLVELAKDSIRAGPFRRSMKVGTFALSFALALFCEKGYVKGSKDAT